MRSALVVVEMALAVVLLIGAGLLVRSFVQLTRVNPGFQPEQALSFRVTLQGEKYRQDAPTRIRVGRVRGTSARASRRQRRRGDERAAAQRPRRDARLRGRRRTATAAERQPRDRRRQHHARLFPRDRRAAAARAACSPTRITPRRPAWRSSTRRPCGAGSPDRDPIGARVSINGVSRAKSSGSSPTCCSGAPRSPPRRCSSYRLRSGRSGR